MKIHKNGFIENSADDKLANFLFHRIKKLEETNNKLILFLEGYSGKTINIFQDEFKDLIKDTNKDIGILKRYIKNLFNRSDADSKNLESLNSAIVDINKRLIYLENNRGFHK